MTKHYLKHILLCLCLLTSINASAYDAEIDGIYYKFSGTNATVTYQRYESSHYISDYSGTVVIPEFVIYNDKTYNVTSIGSRAFEDCSGLTSVTIPNSVTSIGYQAFYKCSGLTSIIIPNSVTSIGDYAFSGCQELASITFPDNVTSIGKSILGGTAWYKSQPDGMIYLGNVAYGYKGNMPEGTKIIIKEGTLTIAGDAFKYCSGLTSVTIPESVTSIGNSAFYQCSGLTSVTFPYSVKTIGNDAFSWTGLTSVSIPKNVTNIGSYVFGGCNNLTSITVEGGNIMYDSRDDCNAIVETHSNSLIAGCKNTIIPNSVKIIDTGAFIYCEGLASITIPKSVTGIGFCSFWGSGITSISIPNSVTYIDTQAFQSCKSLTSVIIGSGVYTIYNAAFQYCSNLTSVTVKLKSPVTIDASTFTNRSNATLYVPIGSKAAYEAADYWKEFKEIIEKDLLPEDIEISGIYYRIEKEEKVAEVIPSPNENKYAGDIAIPSSITYNGETYNVTGIGDRAFLGCKDLTSITIPNSVTYIGEIAFMECGSLTSVNIPSSVTSIDEGAFCGCENLTSIIIPEGVTYIGYYAFLGCSGLTKITIPGSVSVIEDMTFDNCSGLTSIIISEGVKVICPVAFERCSNLTSITLPSSVTIIDEAAFYGCSSLKDVCCYAEDVPETSPYAFYNSPIEAATLHVPASALEAYKTTEPWSGFGEFDPIVLKCATPTIGYANGKLTFKCETEDVAFIYNIKDDDIKYGAGSEVDLCVAYQISVYATKGGIANSDVATATLCWVDQQPEAEGLTDEDAVLEMKAIPVLIQSNGGQIIVSGIGDGVEIAVYGVNGVMEGSAVSVAGQAIIQTHMTAGSIVIVKIGEKSVKVMVK